MKPAIFSLVFHFFGIAVFAQNTNQPAVKPGQEQRFQSGQELIYKLPMTAALNKKETWESNPLRTPTALLKSLDGSRLTLMNAELMDFRQPSDAPLTSSYPTKMGIKAKEHSVKNGALLVRDRPFIKDGVWVVVNVWCFLRDPWNVERMAKLNLPKEPEYEKQTLGRQGGSISVTGVIAQVLVNSVCGQLQVDKRCQGKVSSQTRGFNSNCSDYQPGSFCVEVNVYLSDAQFK